MYKKEKERYKLICEHILSNETCTSVTCKYCKTIWDDKNMISNKYGCAECDKSSQPCLSNPKNKEYVLEYIPKKYHHYLLSTVDIYGVEEINCNSGKVMCVLKDTYGNGGSDYLCMGEYNDNYSISSKPVDSCTINDKIKDNIILKLDVIAITDITLTLDIISRQMIILTLSENDTTKLVPFTINPKNLHDLAVFYCH